MVQTTWPIEIEGKNEYYVAPTNGTLLKVARNEKQTFLKPILRSHRRTYSQASQMLRREYDG